jgi:sporulation protein YlmC with PRC-barrel domain
MNYPRIFADFHNADEQGRLRLNCVGTIEDLSRLNIKLQDGKLLAFYDEELEVDGVVQYSEEENLWVAVIDWKQIKQVEDMLVQATV